LNENQNKKRILETARILFNRFGFHKVPVDEIVSQLGMSKKTFYKYFESKDMLVKTLVDIHIQDINFRVNHIVQNKQLNFIQKIENYLNIIASFHAIISENFMRDIIKYNSDIMKQIEEAGKKLIMENFRVLFTKGIEENTVRSDVDPDLFVTIYSHIVQKMHDPHVLSNISYSFDEINKMTTTILFKGILTEEARKGR